MPRLRGEFRKSYGHPDIVVESTVPAAADWMLKYFEQAIGRGEKFQGDETVQCGWYFVKLVRADGDLAVFEPEFGTMPIQWAPGVNDAFRFLTMQRQICDRLQVEPQYPSLRQSGVVSPNFFSSGKKFRLSRETEAARDSGWVFREGDQRDEDGRHCSLYEIAIHVPAVIPFLALPEDSVIERDGERLEICSASKRVSSDRDAVLRQLTASAFFATA